MRKFSPSEIVQSCEDQRRGAGRLKQCGFAAEPMGPSQQPIYADSASGISKAFGSTLQNF